MPSNYSSLTVTHFSESSGYATPTFMTSDVKGLPLFTDTGSGEVNQATITLRAADGNHITTGVKIARHDRFQIQMTDNNSNNYDRVFEAISIIPSKTKSAGVVLQLECLGIEYHTQKIHYVKPHWFEDAFEVGRDIGQLYEDNNGARQPLINAEDTVYSTSTKIGNGLPKFTINNYEYGLNEDTCYNRWMDLIDKLGASVSAGGVLDFFELGFDTPAVNQIDLAIFTSGGRSITFTDVASDNSRVTIKNAKTVNDLSVADQEGEISNPTGSNILAVGSANHGSLPPEHSKYVSGLFQFTFRPEYDSTLSYKTDAKVKFKKQHYISKIDNNLGNTPPFTVDVADENANWRQIDMGDEFGDSIQYSPWTDGLNQLWANCGSDPKATGAGNMFYDSNIVIWDDKFFRTWAHSRVTTNDTTTALDLLADDGVNNDGWAYDFSDRTTFPRGFRVVLTATTPTGVLAQNSGKDINDRTYKNSVIEFVGRTEVKGSANEFKNWQVKYPISDLAADQALDRMQVAILDESKVYEWRTGTATFDDFSAVGGGNDCFHPYFSVSTAASVDPRPTETNSTDRPDVTKAGGQFTTNINSAIESRYSPGLISAGALPTSPTSAFYKTGAWINFQFPFPPNTFNAISQTVGQFYGGTTTIFEPATLDTGNMHLTHDGKRGFNQGASSEDLLPINALGFLVKITATNPITGKLDGEYNCRCAFIDTSDNIVTQDFTVKFVDNWQDVVLPLSGFQIYRAHKPLAALNLSIPDIITPKEIDVQNIFEWRNLKFCIIQLQDFYDEFGRFNPTLVEDLDNILLLKTVGGDLKLIIDGFRWIKPLLVTTGQETSINLEPDFLQRPFITLYDQLKNDALTVREQERFQNKQLDFTTSGDNTFDVRFGDTIFLEDSKIIDDADRNETSIGAGDGDANTIRLVVKRIEYSLTKPRSGIGGLTRRIIASKRFV